MKGNSYWVWGVFLGVLAAFISNLGLNIQKGVHNDLEARRSRGELKRSVYAVKLWWVGQALVVLGAGADVAALVYAPQSLVTPLGSLTLVSNSLLAPHYLGEELKPIDAYGTILILFGATLAVIFASHQDIVYEVEQLFAFYTRPPFLCYATIVGTYIVVMLHWIRKVKAASRWEDMSPRRSTLEHVSLLSREASISVTDPDKFLRFAYASIAGAVGAQSILFAKCLVELVINTLEGRDHLLLYWQSYAVALCMFSAIFLQIRWLNDGLEISTSLYVVPVFNAFWIVLSVTSGLVFYREYVGMTHGQCVMFASGVLITVAGVMTLSRRTPRGEEGISVTSKLGVDS